MQMDAIKAAAMMAVMALLGLYAGSQLGNPAGGAILFAPISGMACIVSAINHHGKR